MKKKIPYIIAILIFILLIIFIFRKEERVYTKDLFYMDTYINIKIYSDKDVSKYFEEIENIYSDYHNLTNAFEEVENVKNIYYINEKLNIGEVIELDKRLIDIIKYGIDAYDKTNGKINIASFNLTNRWKTFIETEENVPSTSELNNLNIDINGVILENNTIKKESDVKLDLGSIAKGYVTELVGNYLESEGINKYLINAGGNVKVGSRYNNDLYKIGLENPNDSSDIYKILKVENTSIVTSGNYQRYIEIDNIRYHHLIDLETRKPAEFMKSVTVITTDSAKADLMSSYLFVIPIDSGKELIDELVDIEAIWYSLDDEVITSKGFNNYE